MPPVDFSNFTYVPILGVRPAEMRALEETLPADKDNLLPYITLQPWVSSKQFANTIAKVEAAFGNRPLIVDITTSQPDGTRRPVHDAIDELRISDDGYNNWYSFIAEHGNYIPAVQLADPDQIGNQVAQIRDLNRGGVIRLTEPMFRFAPDIAKLFAAVEDSKQLLFIFDFQRQNREILNKVAIATHLSQSIRTLLPECFLSASASTFPDSFVDLHQQEIFERRFFNLFETQLGRDNLMYSDRGSARAEPGGGNGSPAPRVDNAGPSAWYFFREADDEDRAVAYQAASANAVADRNWCDLGIWGTEQIKESAAGGDTIGSPVQSTAVRINIHLHVQGRYGGAPAPTESKWTD